MITVSVRVENSVEIEAEDILQKLGVPVSVVINALYLLESLAYITMQTIAKIVSTTGCAAITPFNFHKLFKSITTGINLSLIHI